MQEACRSQPPMTSGIERSPPLLSGELSPGCTGVIYSIGRQAWQPQSGRGWPEGMPVALSWGVQQGRVSTLTYRKGLVGDKEAQARAGFSANLPRGRHESKSSMQPSRSGVGRDRLR